MEWTTTAKAELPGEVGGSAFSCLPLGASPMSVEHGLRGGSRRRLRGDPGTGQHADWHMNRRVQSRPRQPANFQVTNNAKS